MLKKGRDPSDDKVVWYSYLMYVHPTPRGRQELNKKKMNTEDVERRLKRGAVDVGIDLIDLRTTTEEEEFLQLCGLPSDLPTKGKLRRLIREQKAEQTVFKVSIVVKGALRSHGSRGNVYKTLEKCRGCFLKSAGKEVEYDNDDLVVKAYFLQESDAMDFQSSVNQWEIHKTLLSIDGVEVDPPDPERVRLRRDDLARYYLQHYTPDDSESPCETLNQLESYRLSVPVTEAVEPNDPLALYQSLDVCVGRTKPYKCHLKDKAKYKSVANDPNNILVASWPLHQMLDGLDHHDAMSVVKLSVVSMSDTAFAEYDNRYRVILKLEFFTEVDAAAVQWRTGAQKLDKLTWHTIVHVKDKEKFAAFVEWKGNDTQRQWDEYHRLLDAI